MKHWLVLWIILWINIPAKSQDREPGATDAIVLAIPGAQTETTSSIADFIIHNFFTPGDRYRAIYTWVTHNIKYDTDSMYAINWNKGGSMKIAESLKRRMGVCENFAAIFNDIAVKCNLPSFVVDGYTKQGGLIDKTSHSWCAVFLNEEWLFCDPTWDKDTRSEYNFFLVSPARMILTHMPFDPLFQFLPYPITQNEFLRGMEGRQKNKEPYNFSDTMKAYNRLSEIQLLEASSKRIQQQGPVNELTRNRIAFINMQISIYYEERDMNFYNAATKDFNNASIVFNDLANCRNNDLLSQRSPAGINDQLNKIDSLMASAHKNLIQVGRIIPNEQYDPAVLKNRLLNLNFRVQEQREFFKAYFLKRINK